MLVAFSRENDRLAGENGRLRAGKNLVANDYQGARSARCGRAMRGGGSGGLVAAGVNRTVRRMHATRGRAPEEGREERALRSSGLAGQPRAKVPPGLACLSSSAGCDWLHSRFLWGMGTAAAAGALGQAGAASGKPLFRSAGAAAPPKRCIRSL